MVQKSGAVIHISTFYKMILSTRRALQSVDGLAGGGAGPGQARPGQARPGQLLIIVVGGGEILSNQRRQQGQDQARPGEHNRQLGLTRTCWGAHCCLSWQH